MMSVAVLGFLTVAVWPGDAGAARGCIRPGDRIEVRDSTGVVVSREVRDSRHRGVWACLRSRGRVRLDKPRYDEQVDPFRIAGRFVAFAATGSFDPAGEADRYDGVVLVDLTRGTQYDLGSAELVDPASFQLKRDGSVAFLEGTSRGRDNTLFACVMPSCYERRRAVHVEVLDSGEIPPSSIRLPRSTLRWLNGGQPRSATLR